MASQGITGVVYLEADFLDPKQYPPIGDSLGDQSHLRSFCAEHTTVVGHALGNIARDLSQANVHQMAEHLDALVLATTRVINQANLEEFRGRAGEVLTELQGTLQDTRRLVNGTEVKKILSDAAVTAGKRGNFSRTSRRLRNTFGRLQKPYRLPWPAWIRACGEWMCSSPIGAKMWKSRCEPSGRVRVILKRIDEETQNDIFRTCCLASRRCT